MSNDVDYSDDVDTTGPIAWMAENSVAANLLMGVLMFGGVLATTRITQEVFPEVQLDIVTVSVPYPGASPEEVEEGVVLATEEAVRGVEGIDEVISVSSEGVGTVRAELLTSADPQQTLNDIKSEVDRITSYPEDAEDPEVSLASNRQQVVSVVISGEVDRKRLKEVAERARTELLTSGNISVVEMTGLPPPEISIEVSQENLRRYGLTLPQLAQTISESSVKLPGGTVRTDGGEILVRTNERSKTAEEFREVGVINEPDGTRVTLGEIAEVEDTFRQTDRSTTYNGESAVKIEIFRVGDQTPIEISDEVEEFVDDANTSSSPRIQYSMWNDQSEVYASRINLLLENAWVGLALVLLVLGLFLEPKLAFWVTLGIPISFLGAMFLMPTLGASINMISLFAFILTLGIVVDDAIVVGEAIFNAKDQGLEGLEAAVAGTREVMVPVTFAILTTVTAFSPMLFVPGVMGKFFIEIPIIVIPIFLISLVEVLAILPAHLNHSEPFSPDGPFGPLIRLQRGFSSFLTRFVERVYTPLADAAFRYRYLTLAVSGSVLLVAVGVIAGGFLKFNFMPKIEGDRIIASVQMPVGTPVERTEEVVDKLVDGAQATMEEHGGRESVSRGILAEIGAAGQLAGGPGPNQGSSGAHLGQVAVMLTEASERDVTAAEFTETWRQKVGGVVGADTLDYQFDMGPGGGEPVSIELRHQNTDILYQAAEELAGRIEDYAGTRDINNGFQKGKEQLDLTLTPQAKALGLTETSLARQVRGNFYGIEVDRVQRGRDEMRIFVRRPDDERSSMYYLEDMVVRTPRGGEIPLADAAHIERGRAATQIEREGGARVVDVTSDVEESVTTGGAITADLQARVLPELLAKYKGLSYELSGEQQARQEGMAALQQGFLLAMFVMFALMAVVFRSYAQPLVIMFSIPFGFVGAVAGHLLMGFNLSLISMFGLVALSGVVVNDSIVLVAAINDYRERGATPLEAVVEGGKRRFRPILLTSLTTFFGLVPMIFETSVQAQFLIPMALSLGFGVLLVTAIALIIVPSLYLVVIDLKGLLGIETSRRHV